MTFVWIIVAFIALFFIFYFALKKFAENEKKKEAEAKIQNQLNAEKKAANRQAIIANAIGLEKPLMLNNVDADAQQEGIKAMRQLGVLIEQSVVQEKEKDWAIHGGIAQGIAGPIAGVAIALDTMNKNKEIRERNAANKAWGTQQKNKYYAMADEAERNAPKRMTMHDIKKEFWAVYHKHWYELTTRNVNYKIHPLTGSVTVTADWEVSERCNKCIDGSYIAKIYDENCNLAGYAFLNLPINGTLDRKGRFEGVCPFIAKKSQYYTIQIEPYNLYQLIISEDKNLVKGTFSEEEQRRRVANLKKELELELCR